MPGLRWRICPGPRPTRLAVRGPTRFTVRRYLVPKYERKDALNALWALAGIGLLIGGLIYLQS